MANPGTELASLDFGNLIGGPLVAVITAQSLAAEATAKFIKDVGFNKDVVADDGTITSIGAPVYVDFKYPKEVAPYIPGVGQPDDTLLPPYIAGKAEVQDIDIALDAAHATNFKVTGANFDTEWVGRTIDNSTTIIESVESDTAMTLSAELTAGTSSIDIDAVPDIGQADFPDGRPAYVPQVSAVYQEMIISVPILTMLPIPFIKVDIITIDFNAKINSMETASTSTEAAVSGTLSARYGGKFSPASVSFNGSASYKKSTTSGSSVERTYSMAIHVQASQDEMPAGMEKLLNLLEGAMISTPGVITSES